MESLPFSMSAYEGFGVVEGRVRDTESALAIEFHVKDNVFGAFKSGLRSITIPFTSVEAVRYEARRFRKSRLEIDVNDATLLEKIPGTKVGTLTLRLDKKTKPHAERIVQRINRHLMDHRLLHDNRELSDQDLDYLFDDDDR